MSFVIILDNYLVCLKNILEIDFLFKFVFFCCFFCSYCYFSWYKLLNLLLVISGFLVWSKFGIIFYCILWELWRVLCYKGCNWLFCYVNCLFFLVFIFYIVWVVWIVFVDIVWERLYNYVEEFFVINNNRDIIKINLLCNIWCCVVIG